MSVISRLKVVIEANSAALRQELAKAKADTRKFSKSTNRRMKDIQRSAMQAGAALGSAFAVQGITRRADEMTQMASKLDVVTGRPLALRAGALWF